MSDETVQLAQHVARIRFEDLPDALVEELKVLTLDYLGVAVRGAYTESARIVAEYHRTYSSSVLESAVIGHGWRMGAAGAAFSNAVAAHSIELDDVDDLALLHFSPPVLSSALAVGEAKDCSGREFLLAAGVGCEIMARLSQATNPMLRDRGFHSTAVCGVFGSTAAAATLEALDAEQVASALGIAGAHAAGLMEMYGPSMQKRINPGPAAQNGVVAARLARRGFKGSDRILEGERGVLRAFAGQNDPSALTAGLGSTFPISIEYKPYACARPIHNAIDCALGVRESLDGQLDSIRSLVVRRHPSWANYHQIPCPNTYHEAQVSINHAVAVALVEGAAFFDQFADDRIRDPRIARLSQMLRVEVDASLPRGVSCRLILEREGGPNLEAQVDYPKGSRANPISAAEHRAKFRTLAGSRLDPDRLDDIQDLVSRLETVESMSTLMRLVKRGPEEKTQSV